MPDDLTRPPVRPDSGIAPPPLQAPRGPRFDPVLRAASVPAISYPEELPVVARRDEIAKLIRENQVIVLCGETGSGKTTQLPKICLEIGRGLNGFIGHTQPRRLAARTVAQRIADELRVNLGVIVGYKVRFGDHTGPGTLVKLMTDGILLAETQNDRLLRQYDTIIIDEAHERSLNIDFLLGYLKRILPRRPDLKLIITSATIDPGRFSTHFNDAPVINVSGRTFPVETRYMPLRTEDAEDADLTELEGISAALSMLQREAPGDTLVFLPTERDIREAADVLSRDGSLNAEVLPLFARLNAEQQMKVFRPSSGGGRRRVILATNVAETSVTVPGIRYVIDTGLARISRYARRSRVQRLPIEPISQASADQRKGRCGRVAPGVCVRLYAEDDFARRPRYTDPEIQRTHLAAVILQMMGLGLGEIQDFPFIDPPDYRMIRDGYATLHEIGAIDEENRITPVGRRLAVLPVDPRLGRMMLAGEEEDCLEDVTVIAAALSCQDARERPMDMQQQADEAHARFRDEQSDFVTILKLWQLLRDKQKELSNSGFRKFCKNGFISYARVREWQEVHRQLRDIAADDRRAAGRRGERRDHRHERSAPIRPAAVVNLVVESDGFDPFTPGRRDALHRALLAGLLANIGFKSDGFQYSGARGNKFSLFPGSALFKSKPQWVMAAEIVETTKLYARTCAPLKPEWVERLAGHLIKRTYADPSWQKDTAHVVAFEKVMLWGLVLVQRRPVQYGPIDPKLSRELFIHHALVHHEFRTDSGPLLANHKLVDQVVLWEAKSRRRDLLNEPSDRYAFYDLRVPTDVWSGPTFDKWRKRGDGSNSNVLRMTTADVLRPGTPPINLADYPDTLALTTAVVPLVYKFEPGEPDDGVTAVVPLNALHAVPETRGAWLVPGQLAFKVEELIRTLPKRLRTKFVPVSDTVAKVMPLLPPFSLGSVEEAVAGVLWKLGGEPVTKHDFQPDQLPPQLAMNFRVLDSNGGLAAEGRDLIALRAKLGQKLRSGFSALKDLRYTKEDLLAWDFGDLPPRVVIEQHGALVYGFPTLVDEEGKVSLRLLDSQQSSDAHMRAGLRRLFLRQSRKEVAQTLRDIPGMEKMRLLYKPFGPGDELAEDFQILIADRAFFDGNPAAVGIRTKEAFAKQAGVAWKRTYEASRELGRTVSEVLTTYHAVAQVLSRDFPPLLLPSVRDLREQLNNLLPKRFLRHVPPSVLPNVPRYLHGIESRLKKLQNAGLPRDAQQLSQITPLWERWKERHRDFSRRGIADPALVEFRWLLEEFRVSLFAQELKTAVPVSLKKLEGVWQNVRRA